MVKLSPRKYSVGVDLGQAADYTAVAVLEKKVVPPETAMFAPVGSSPDDRLVEGSTLFDLVYLKRPPLHTPYDAIAEAVADLVAKLEPEGAFGEVGHVTLSVDGTGVGRGVCDMLIAELRKREARGEYIPRVDFRAVTVTGANSVPKRPRSKKEYWNVPKRDLVFPAVVAFQQKKLRVARDVEDKDALVDELRNYSRKTNISTGAQVFEPWREGQHDDLIFAVCLALWGWTQREPQWNLRAIA